MYEAIVGCVGRAYKVSFQALSWRVDDPRVIATILCFKDGCAKDRVEYLRNFNGSGRGAFVVEMGEKVRVVLEQSPSGLHYHDMNGPKFHKMNSMALLNTVADNKGQIWNEDCTRAVKARVIQIGIRRPSMREFMRIVETKLLPNYSINREDVLVAEDIFGPKVRCLKGKATQRWGA
jgi:hypothetical protein